ncbi:hypothetical protein [Micromonospora sp. DT229]|uniref:hypothetical protein n=1 Tax=Micromonospora sp. DT229 TaxID=3393430 RepID=UPI003CF9EC2B
MNLNPVTETFHNEDQRWLGSAHGTESAQSITLDTSAFTSGVHYPNGYFPSGLPLGRITASGKYGPYAGRTSEVQTVSITGGPTGGTFTLTFAGETTAAIPYNATAAQVRAALEALASINTGEVTTAGGQLPGTPVTVTFGGRFAGDNVPQMTAGSGSLTGGSTPTAAVTTSTGGAGGATDGTEVLAGHLLCTVDAPSDNTQDPQGALFWHGRVIESHLPIGVDDAGKRDVAGRIQYV